MFAVAIRSSPRAWGCFLQGRIHRNFALVFPTSVGMVLKARTVALLIAKFFRGTKELSALRKRRIGGGGEGS